jgi:hypothetical protein
MKNKNKENFQMNGQIITADILFCEPSGKQGQNFLVRLTIKAENGVVGICDYNPLRLPQLLRALSVESFCSLENTLVKIDSTMELGESSDDMAITHILDAENNYFPNDNGVYFGEEYI